MLNFFAKTSMRRGLSLLTAGRGLRYASNGTRSQSVSFRDPAVLTRRNYGRFSSRLFKGSAASDNNYEAYNIPQLPVLDTMVARVQKSGLIQDVDKTFFVGAQHNLETTVSLYNAFIQCGAKPQNMYFTGKCYSTSRQIQMEVYKKGINIIPDISPKYAGTFREAYLEQLDVLWDEVQAGLAGNEEEINRLIILDDGGRCLEQVPNVLRFGLAIASAEQTRGGLYSSAIGELPFPLIEVASSAAKRSLESPFIAKAVLTAVKKFLGDTHLSEKAVYGVVGNGAIGMAIAEYLLGKGLKVAIYDQDEDTFSAIKEHRKLYRLSTVTNIIANCDYIFGCTGRDITEGIDIKSVVTRDKYFISCTSEDKEFLTLLKKISLPNNVFSDLVYQLNDNARLVFVGGGFPINFDRKPWCVPANDIALTQGLLFSSWLQAIRCAKKAADDGITVNRHARYCLDPYMQRFVVKTWAASQPEGSVPKEKLECFDDIEWIKRNSGGEYNEDLALKDTFFEAAESRLSDSEAAESQLFPMPYLILSKL